MLGCLLDSDVALAGGGAEVVAVVDAGVGGDVVGGVV